jgi:hypothetical protein
MDGSERYILDIDYLIILQPAPGDRSLLAIVQVQRNRFFIRETKSNLPREIYRDLHVPEDKLVGNNMSEIAWLAALDKMLEMANRLALVDMGKENPLHQGDRTQ